MSSKRDFHNAVSTLLVQKLDKFKNKSLNKENCTAIYETIFKSLEEVLVNADVKIENESMNWVAQCYYDSVSINRGHELDPNIFTKRAELTNIPTKELALLAMMLRETPFISPIVATIKRRS